MPTKSIVNFTTDRQAAAETYVLNSIGHDKLREPSAKQALNDAFSGRGKASATMTVDGRAGVRVKHASSGSKDKNNSVTVFFHTDEDANGLVTKVYLLAVGGHKTDSTYALDKKFGQDDFPFKAGSTVNVDGSQA
ncbi:hypothetical protein [Streptomyces sp. WMMC905]|uniref:hypothetical protein n=1 Tax=Streptomyces sp. WMMC905 TaxID=3404123 RepID=UPI0031FD2B38